MNDKKLKDMWKSAEYFMDTLGYESNTIEGFLSNRSGSVANKIKKMIQADLGFKIGAALFLILDSFLYFEVQRNIAYICTAGVILIIPLILFELSTLRQFNSILTVNRNIKETLSGMLSFLENRSTSTLLSIASTYLFFFSGGVLLYFFVEYGELRRMGSMDIFVFPSICIMGIIINLAFNYRIIKYQILHLKLCLSDVEEELLPQVASKIESRRKNEMLISILVGAVLFLAFFLLVAVLKALGL